MAIILNHFKFLNYLLLFIVLKYIKSEDLCKEDNCKSILMKGKIIFIKNKYNDISINYYDFDKMNISLLRNYSSINIKEFKNILKLNDTDFIVFGVNYESNNYIFYYDIYSIIETNGKLDITRKISSQRNFGITYLEQIDAKAIDSKKLIIYGISNGYFATYLIDLGSKDTNNYLSYQFQRDQDIDSRLTPSEYAKKNIQCNSLNGNNFFCSFYYAKQRVEGEYLMFYLNGNFNNSTEKKILRNICSDCANGNIEKINDDKYLLCYQQKTGPNFIIICRYFFYTSNYFEEGKDIYQYFVAGSGKLDLIPLMIYEFKNIIFISFNYKTLSNKFAYIIILSLDFKINLDIQLLSDKADSGLSTINFFNDDNFIYHSYLLKEGSSTTEDTKINRKELIKCQPSENITLSANHDSQSFNFIKNHENMDIRFSINDNLLLIPSITYYSPSLDSNNNFIFKRRLKSGIFDNYYIYSNSVNFSLICNINITSCYSLCDTCSPNKEGTDKNNHCKNCITGYNPKEDESGNNFEDFNCYKDDELIMNYYKDPSTGKFMRCHRSCKYCSNSNSCKACNDGYYFIYENGNINTNTICFTGPLNGYYLSTNEIIQNSYMNFQETIDTVYKSCYKTCSTCLSNGSELNNNCLTCISSYQKYPFEQRQCLINHNNECFYNRKYWEIKTNTIYCKDGCSENIILYGNNRGQCVSDCTNFINPYSSNTMYFTLVNCNNKNYCIPLDVCRNGKFDVFYENKTCIRKTECNIDIFNGIDPFIHDYDPVIETTIIPPSEITDIPLTPDEKRNNILRRKKLIENLYDNNDYIKYNKSDNDLMKEYIQLFNKYSEGYEKDGIYLILFKQYKNFNITIYPLDIESFAYDNVFAPNNLGFINFINYLQGYFNYEVNTHEIILVILLESLSLNSSINELNYYFYGMNENHYEKSRFINISESNIIIGNIIYKSMYPLKNYYNENSTLEKRNTEHLIDNIRSFYINDPKIELYNLNNPFFNDICFQFSSEIGTDLTLNDRREEYYINKSLCEDNCYLEKLIINQDCIKSLCSCQLKKEFSFNKNAGVKDDIPLITINMAKSVFCYNKAFSPQNIARNIVFWVFIVFIIFLFIMFFVCICYGSEILNKIFKIKENNDEVSENIEIRETSNNINSSDKENKNKNKLSSNDNQISDINEIKEKYSITISKNSLNSKLVMNKKKNRNNNIKIKDIKNLKSFSKNSSIYEFNNNIINKKNSENNVKSIQLNIGSSNTDKSNPPKNDIQIHEGE